MSRELDAQIAERVMGESTVERTDTFGAYKFLLKPHPHESDTQLLHEIPAYSTDLNACATAEARIISMGLGEKYAWELEKSTCAQRKADFAKGLATSGLHITLITTSAEARCRAMLATLEGK